MEPSIEHTYRLFGHLWLESPEKYLPAEDLKTLRQLEPLILELENRHVPGKSIIYYFVSIFLS
jgi:hypothetical protein